MRILDLGSHDGYIAAHVARQLGAVVDGVELNEQAVAVAAQRHGRQGLAGEFKVGFAEDAPDLFEPGTYDAVIAFELIEHVPQVDRLLDAAEAMLKPGGRVYLSTPDGTFGAGQNPHHLRVYRAVDLVDLLRSRGEVVDMRVGPDGVIFAAYEPWGSERQGHGSLAIYCGPGWQTWSPLDIERSGLGGSETAAVRLAEVLQERGFTVTVFGEVDPGAYRQVVYRHHSVFDPTVARAGVISSRSPHLFDRPVNAASKVLWMHDTDYGPALTEQRAVHVDAVMVLSRWHAHHVRSLYPFVSDKLRLTANGIVPGYFTDEDPALSSRPAHTRSPRSETDLLRNPHRAIYSSSPDRGLDFLLECWPGVRALVPDAELAYCYSDVYDAVAKGNPALRSFRAKIRELADQPGVVNLGSLPQPVLALEMRRSKAWLAPSWSTPAGTRFHETFCIGAVEAAAAGCMRIMSDWGALTERDEAPSIRLKPPPEGDGPPDRDQWVHAICGALKRGHDGTPAPGALQTTWDRVADDFCRVLLEQTALVAG